MQDEVEIDSMMPPDDGDGTRDGPIFTDIDGPIFTDIVTISSSAATIPVSLLAIMTTVLGLLTAY